MRSINLGAPLAAGRGRREAVVGLLRPSLGLRPFRARLAGGAPATTDQGASLDGNVQPRWLKQTLPWIRTARLEPTP